MRVSELFDLSGKTAIVTGGGSGIGRQMAGALAELGANIVVCARKLERCEDACAELSELGVRTLALRCDVREPSDVQAVVDNTLAELGRVDVLVNNVARAGAPPRRRRPGTGGRRSST